ncbi:MAG: hypothetical protein KF878_33000 [Planctomycetes bacterium]|nr:hypothetical protein [Planctomycetota bacterium]
MTAEATVREGIPALARPLRRDELAAALTIVRRLRDLGSLSPGADAAADAVVAALQERFVALTGPEAHDAEPDVRLLEALAESGLLPLDPLPVERLLDQAMVVFYLHPGALTSRHYHRVLLAMIRLDVDVLRDHVLRAPLLGPDLARGAAGEYLALRLRWEKHAHADEQTRIAADLLELMASPRIAELGPVTRGRGTWLVARQVGTPAQSLERLDRAIALDPRSPYPHHARAGLLADMNEPAAAAASAREAVARLERDGFARRPSTRYDAASMLRSAFHHLLRAGQVAEARSVLVIYEALDQPEKLDELRAALREAERASGRR